MKHRGVAKPLASLRARGVQWLAQREHSASELRQKLLRHARLLQASAVAQADSQAGRHAATEEEAHEWLAAVEDALAWLTAQGYLSDARFVQSRLSVRAQRFGNVRIRQELAQHQLELAPEAALALQASEIDRAQAVCRRKFPDPPQNAAECAKQARFLAQRGFSADVVRRVLRDAVKNQRNAVTENDPSP